MSAMSIINTYISNGHKLHHPNEPFPTQMGRPRINLNSIKNWLMDKLPEWKFTSLDKRVTQIES